jgi:hypothetical protein
MGEKVGGQEETTKEEMTREERARGGKVKRVMPR